MPRLKWGILSTARIGLEAVVPALQKCRNGEVVAIASRQLPKAEQAAGRLGIPVAHGSYEALLADPQVEAVYSPLPNHLHLPWSIRALEAGKHVLCEKPVALNADQAGQLIEAAAQHPGLKVMEAFMYRFHPQWTTIRGLLGAGSIGRLTTIYSTFTYRNLDPQDYRNVAEYGGGGLLDVGVYSISSSRWLFEAEPERVLGIVEYDPAFGTDRLASAILDFGVGTATFTCATQIPRHQRADLCGSLGRIVIEAPFNPPPDAPARAWVHSEEETRELVTPAADQYRLMGEAFAEAVQAGTDVPTPLTDAQANLRVVDAIFESGKRGGWVRL